MPLQSLPAMTMTATTQPEPSPSQTSLINTAILSCVREAAIVFGTASQSRTALQDSACLLTDFDHFNALCVADLKSAFNEQRLAQSANRIAKTQGKKTQPNRIVRNRKGSWETLFRYFARHARIGFDIDIRAHGHQGDYTCELVAKEKRESEFEKAMRVCEEHGMPRADLEALYLRSLEDRMEDEAAESTDQQHEITSQATLTQAANASQGNIRPDDIASIANGAQQTKSATPAPMPGKPDIKPVHEENLQVLEKIAHSGSQMAEQARQLLDRVNHRISYRIAGAASAGGHHSTVDAAMQTSLSQQARNKAYVWSSHQNGSAKEMPTPVH